MQDSPEDLPKPPRRTAARPFFSPRPSGEGVTGPLELSSRRTAQLFTPPRSTQATPAADTAPNAAPNDADSVNAPTAASPDIERAARFDADESWSPSPVPATEQTLDADSIVAHRTARDDEDQLVVEQYEPEEIELTSAAAMSAPDGPSIEVIAYDDANSMLTAAANEGERLQVDGLRLETTEFSFQEESVPRLEVESFWATEPFGAADAQKSAPPPPISEAAEGRAVDAAEMALDGAEAVAEDDAHPLDWGEKETYVVASTEPHFADIAPPWAGRPTPVSSQSLEELKESEPWAVSPTVGEPATVDADAMPFTFVRDEPLHAEPAAAEPVIEPPARHDVADALERIAARVRRGDIDVPAGPESSDAAALAAVLTALLRLPH